MSADGKMTIWMALRNAREVIAGLKQTSSAVGVLGSTTDRLASKMERAGRRTFLMNQALFTLRRYSYMATLALTAGTAAVLRWGFQYDSQVQTAKIAFRQFGLTQAGVNMEIAKLYKIAAITPFLFTDITNSARRFMAFGVSVKTTNALITNLTDALTAMGFTSGASLQRATLALVHMQTLGRVTGQLVFQLTRDNIPIVQALEKELGVLPSQLHNISALGIPASTAIAALNKYISETPRFHNAAIIFATRTWRGIVTTTRDYMAQFLGRVEEPLFKSLQKSARKFMFWLTGAGQRGFNNGGLAGMFATFSPGLARFWTMMATAVTSLWRILVTGLIPAFVTVFRLMAPILYLVLWPTIKAFEILSHHTLIAKIFFALLAAELGIMAIRFAVLLPLQTVLILRMITWNTLQRIAILLGLVRIETIDTETGAIITNTAATTKSYFVMTRFTKYLAARFIPFLIRTRTAWTLLTKGYVAGSTKMSYSMKSLEGMALRLRLLFMGLRTAVLGYVAAIRAATTSMIMFLLTNPIGWAILLISALTILYFKWRAFHNVMNEIFRFIRNNAPIIAAALTVAFGPIGAAVGGLLLIIKYWGRIKNFFGFSSPTTRAPHTITGSQAARMARGGIPHLAAGGSVMRGGYAMVGENGPEIRYLPTGAVVSPIGKTQSLEGFDMSNLTIEFHNHTTLVADGRKLAEVVSKHRLDGAARR